MNKQTNIEESDDDVVVIEERDRRTYLYIAIAGVLGLALGGLIGSTFTASKGNHLSKNGREVFGA